MKSYIGIDNGVTGTIGVISNDKTYLWKTPVKTEQNYTKAKQNINRVDVVELDNLLQRFENPFAIIERPFVNPKMFKASLSAIRALEVTMTFCEASGIGFVFVDSKEWQKELLPSGVKGTPNLKRASRDIGIRMFPEHRKLIEKHGDADGILIAEYARRKF